MTKQEVFDKVVKHLLTQNEQAVTKPGGDCQYRGQNNTKCAIGCLIPDVMYNVQMEGLLLTALVKREFTLPTEITNNILLLADLQEIHDVFNPAMWVGELAKTAKIHGLEFNEC